MPRRRQIFTPAGLKRALQGAIQGAINAGLKPVSAEIDPTTGKIVLRFEGGAAQEASNPFDEWKAKRQSTGNARAS
jgi:hypothetical protein